MKILVTGSAGFIGFHLVRVLLQREHSIIGIDNINSYYDVNLKYERLNVLGIDKSNIENDKEVLSSITNRFTFIKCDIANNASLEKIFENHKFDKVCNLAAQAGVRYSFENPGAYIQSNVVGFMNMIELSHKYNVKHFIYASSSSVYGCADKTPFSESNATDNPESIYAATKKSNELIAHVYGSQLNLPVTGLRFFTVYGPYGRPDMAPALFTKAILEGKEINIFYNGNLSRAFSFIDYIVCVVVRIIENDPKSLISVFNIGNCKPIKLMDFINTLEKYVGKVTNKNYLSI